MNEMEIGRDAQQSHDPMDMRDINIGMSTFVVYQKDYVELLCQLEEALACDDLLKLAQSS